jgi:hypothetical protein
MVRFHEHTQRKCPAKGQKDYTNAPNAIFAIFYATGFEEFSSRSFYPPLCNITQCNQVGQVPSADLSCRISISDFDFD